MSSPAETNVVRKLFVAWNARDYGALIATCDPAVEIDSAVARAEGSGLYRGHDGARAWLRDNVETLGLSAEVEQSLCYRGLVLQMFTVTTRAPGSGVELKREGGGIYEVRDGLIRRVFIYVDPVEAIAAFAHLTQEQAAGSVG